MVEKMGDKAHFKGSHSMSKQGQPQLPVYKVTFLLPPGADLESVTAIIKSTTEQELEGEYIVEPERDTLTEKENPVIDGKDTLIYRKNAFFPADYLGETSGGNVRQYKIVTVPVNPYRYNPVTKKLRTITDGTLEIKFTMGNTKQKLTRNARTESLLKLQVVNPEIFEEYGVLAAVNRRKQDQKTIKDALSVYLGKETNDDYKKLAETAVAKFDAGQTLDATRSSVWGNHYLVITTNYIKENSTIDFFLLLTVWLVGGSYEIITIEEKGWQSVTGQDRADAIRTYLRNNWQSNDITNVLLIGSADPVKGDIPMFNIAYPTDLNYADMDLSVNGSGDIAVGRIPAFYTDPTTSLGVPFNMNEINEILNRSAYYSTHSGSSAEYRRMALLPIVPLGQFNSFFGVNSQVFAEEIIIAKIKSNKAGWNFFRLYEPYDWNFNRGFVNSVSTMNPLPEVPFCNQHIVPHHWNSQMPGLVVFNTHGWPFHGTSVLGTDDMGYTGSGQNFLLKPGSVTYLRNDYPAVVFAASCYTAPPDLKHLNANNTQTWISNWEGIGPFVNHLGYQTLVHNAVAYIGASRDIGQTTNKPAAEAFVDCMTRPGINCSVGEALNYTRNSAGSGSHLLNLWGPPNIAFNLDDLSPTLGVPQNFQAYANTYGDPKTQVRVRWDAVSGASSYVIEKGDADATRGGGFQFLTEVTTTNYIDNNLPSATKLKYRVYAKTSQDRGPYTSIDSTTTYNQSNQALKPLVPSIGANGYGNAHAIFLVNANPNGPAPTYLRLKRSTSSSGPFVTVQNFTPGIVVIDSNLINGTNYYYRISAVNEFGESGNSGIITANPYSPGDGNVAPPVLFEAYCGSAPDVNTVSFRWRINETPSYIGSVFEYMEQMPDGNFASINDNQWTNQWARFHLGNRKNREDNDQPGQDYYRIYSNESEVKPRGNVRYQFRIRNYSNPGDNPDVYHYSQPIVQEIKLYNDLNKFNPAAPVWVSASQIQPEIIRLTWNYTPKNNDPSPIKYRVYWKNASGGTWRTEVVSALSYDLQVGMAKTVDCYVRACYSKNGIEIDGEYSVKKTLSTNNQLSAPIAFNAFTKWGNRIMLSWYSNSVENCTFKIDRKIGSGSWVINAYTAVSGEALLIEFENTGLTPGTQYTYRIRAYFNGTYSAYSEEVVSATFKATAQSYISPYEPNLAIDNDWDSESSRWGSSNPPKWWQLDMNATSRLIGVRIKWRSEAVWKYYIEISTNGSSWTEVVNRRDRTDTEQQTTDYFPGFPTCRYLRITVTDGPANAKTGFYEVEPF